jgi:23S rRNA (adenine2030-N6)-methyltransferase
MLGYRHGFHAGNFADVFKHVLLARLIWALRAKDKSFRVIDTHAGAGRYDLAAPAAQKNREFINGIGRLWGQNGLSPELHNYLQQVQALNPDGHLRWYPGSPRITRALLRPDDRLALTELHPDEFPRLKAEFRGDQQVVIQHADGYAVLQSFLPPPERRGLVLLDPAYEFKGEFDRLVQTIDLIQRRWAGAMIAVWYPIPDHALSTRFQRVLSAIHLSGVLCAELRLSSDQGPSGLQGCGMITINPPWRFDDVLRSLLPELLRHLKTNEYGQTRLEWFAPAP